ncbi:MAG: hypothetical protein AB4911_24555, partial [Oscillochloridaceae bacterium umkhey_bin13]
MSKVSVQGGATALGLICENQQDSAYYRYGRAATPPELSEDAWQATPLEVRQFIALLVMKLAAIEARLNQTSQNSS